MEKEDTPDSLQLADKRGKEQKALRWDHPFQGPSLNMT
jgi:hypothetical protein